MYPHCCSVKQIRKNFNSTDWKLHLRESRELTLLHCTPYKNHRVNPNSGSSKDCLLGGDTGHSSLGCTCLLSGVVEVLPPCHNQTTSRFSVWTLSSSSVCKTRSITRLFVEHRASDSCLLSSALLWKSWRISHTPRHSGLITSPSRACSFTLTGRCNSAFAGA